MAGVRNPDGFWINTECFRDAGRCKQKNGWYTEEPYGSPSWYDFWAQERERCLNGYSVGGARITGDHYFYLNYCPIKVTKSTGRGRTGYKEMSLPDFWEGDYNYFWFREIARRGIIGALRLSEKELKKINALDEEKYMKKKLELLDSLQLIYKPLKEDLDGGLDLIVGKARRRGFSYKNASVSANNFFHRPDTYTMVMAYESKYLYPGDRTFMFKVYKYINYVNDNTGWTQPSDFIRKQDHIRASYMERNEAGIPVEKGLMSEIQAVSFKDNPDAGRGADAYDIFGEEVGAWGVPGGLKDTIAAMNSSTEGGMFKTGMITLFGCVCKGTKVWDKHGVPRNIEDITKDTGIIGYACNGVINENISWIKPPAKKPCYRITTNKGLTIECSNDHPLLYVPEHIDKNHTVYFKKAEDLKVGERLLSVRQVPIFGTKKMRYPRLVGMLIGDGYYGYKATPQLAISDRGIEEYLKENNISYTVYKNCDERYYKYVGLHGIRDDLIEIGIYGQTKKMKRLPSDIYDYNMESVAELLGGYFDTDGYFYHNKKKNAYKISLVSVVPELLEEVKIQLYKLGIGCSIFKRHHKQGVVLVSNINKRTSVINTEYSYSLEISSIEDVIEFKKHIRIFNTKGKKILDSVDINRNGCSRLDECSFKQTIEHKGDFFVGKKLDNLCAVKIKKIEYIGEQDVYNLTTDYTHTYITNTFVSHNTSGDLEKGTVDFADMFDSPGKYNFMRFYDIWGDFEDKVEGFFFPKQLNMEGFYDANGNSDMEGAKNYELEFRKKKKADGASSTDMQKRMYEEPLNSSEAFGIISHNSFPVVELKARLELVKAKGLQKTKGTPVRLFREEGKVKAQPVLDGSAEPITSMERKVSNLEGCVIIYEFPQDNPPRGLYKIGYDPIRQDTGTSLAALIVYKGVAAGEFKHDIIVAEYVGRYMDADENDRLAEMLADYFNTTIMYENECTGTKNYFRKIHRLNLLASQPDRVISKNISKSKVDRVYGCHMVEQLKDAGERYIRSWLVSVIDYIDKDGEKVPVTTIDTICSERLLEELIKYNRKGNFDLVSALIMCMFQVQENYFEDIDRNNEKKDRQDDVIEMYNEMTML